MPFPTLLPELCPAKEAISAPVYIMYLFNCFFSKKIYCQRESRAGSVAATARA
jgi:hypothetical protein